MWRQYQNMDWYEPFTNIACLLAKTRECKILVFYLNPFEARVITTDGRTERRTPLNRLRISFGSIIYLLFRVQHEHFEDLKKECKIIYILHKIVGVIKKSSLGRLGAKLPELVETLHRAKFKETSVNYFSFYESFKKSKFWPVVR